MILVAISSCGTLENGYLPKKKIATFTRKLYDGHLNRWQTNPRKNPTFIHNKNTQQTRN